MSLFEKLLTSLCIAGASSCFTLVIYREITLKPMVFLENEDDSDMDYNILSFEEKGDGFKWEVVEKDGETFIVVDDDTDEDFFIESEKVTDPEKTCYVYKYPKKLIHLI